MAKGIGNGLPLGAVVTTPEIAATLAQRLHFNTYGGNPVCSAGGRAVSARAGVAGFGSGGALEPTSPSHYSHCSILLDSHQVLRVIDQEGIQAKAADVGGHLLEGLRGLAAKHDVIGDVRGLGLMTGMELVKDRATKVIIGNGSRG